ncbi:hypothetical protein SHKM778_11630 [Streptomyces sp. KM77-8]|uniref:Uncharacterized protein n=1 Tax=Streptomyces haneummycinicus TaxID=3074435 RepID=A0AAT9HBI1_9ACTN
MRELFGGGQRLRLRAGRAGTDVPGVTAGVGRVGLQPVTGVGVRVLLPAAQPRKAGELGEGARGDIGEAAARSSRASASS